MVLQKSLATNLEQYHKMVLNAFSDYFTESADRGVYEGKRFLELLYAPRKSFLDFCRKEKLTYSTISGTILEWTLYHCLNAVLKVSSKSSLASAINGRQISYKWKSSGTKKLNIDLVIENRQTHKLYYAFEIKTNFEDGFKKYREEETRLYHHRRKVFPDFKYFYLSLTPPPAKLINDYKGDLNTLQRREELYIFNEHPNEFPGAEEFLGAILAGIEKID